MSLILNPLEKIPLERIKVYAFVGPSGTGKSYRAQMVADSKNIEYIIDDGLLVSGNQVIAGVSAKKAPTKIETVKNALFQDEEKRKKMQEVLRKKRPKSILILGTSDGMVEKIAKNLGLSNIIETIYIKDVATEEEMETARRIRVTQGKHVILYGYSAGTFINYQYMIYKLPYINLEKLFTSLGLDEDFIGFVKENPMKNTCLSALSDSKGNIGVISNTGHLVLNQNVDKLKENYLKLDEVTERYCAPEGAVKGFVNFASPIPLFYSDISDKNYEITFFNKYAIKYVLENGLYFLTVNFREDPLGFPSGRNLTIPQYEEILDLTLENPTGVIYDNSSVWSKRSALFAHTSYWSARSVFAKAVVKSFVEGTKFQYNEEYQQQVLNKEKKN